MSLSQEISSDLTSFLSYVINDCCKCIKNECYIQYTNDNDIVNMDTLATTFYNNFLHSKLTSSINDNVQCGLVDLPKPLSTIDFRNVDAINKVRNIFLKYKLITKSSSKYYLLNGSKKLTWKNIKNIDSLYIQKYKTLGYHIDIFKIFDNQSEFNDDTFVVFLQYLFWYFRKAIVNTIITNIFSSLSTPLLAISVGSTTIKSDYDITLYGDSNLIFNTIRTFNTSILKLFNTSSELLFDTNVYGLSFIKSGKQYICNNTNFDILKPQSSDVPAFLLTQNIWALIKLINNLNKLQDTDETLYELLEDTLTPTNNFNFSLVLDTAKTFVDKNDSNPKYYDKIVKLSEAIPHSINEYLNYTSFVNYNGLETYYTRGAFIDIVVNSQMCKQNIIKLSQSEYLDSTIENLADLLLHYTKTKYLTRVQNSLTNLPFVHNVNEYLQDIANIQLKCKSSHTLVNCSRFMLMKICVKTIKHICESYFNSLDSSIIQQGITLFNQYSQDLPTELDYL